MAWIKVPPENHPLFVAALPKDPRIETVKMFGAVAAKVNGHMFAGLFARSTMVMLGEADRAAAMRLDGCAPFDPMGNGRHHGDKVLLPESVTHDPKSLRVWLARAFKTAALLPAKTPAKSKAGSPAAPKKKSAPQKKTVAAKQKKR